MSRKPSRRKTNTWILETDAASDHLKIMNQQDWNEIERLIKKHKPEVPGHFLIIVMLLILLARGC